MTTVSQPPRNVRLGARIRGVVQGVGFRPFIYGLARRHGLSGWVLNDEKGVLLEVEGPAVHAFFRDLETKLPPLARIDAIDRHWRPTLADDAEGFAIRTSTSRGAAATMVPADAAPCSACLRELFDPADRRYLYPFLNCTHCGPRHTITARVPYDRPNTSMSSFTLCPACAREYDDPADRRFHAQPTACPACGPRLARPVAEVVAAIEAGAIVALQGVGGFHLLCDARREPVVQQLRARKDREAKPFAVMVLNAASAGRLAAVGERERAVLESTARPIVLLEGLPGPEAGARLVPAVSTGSPTVGLVLPPSPLHYLLFYEALGRPAGTDWLSTANDVAFVLTSANPGGAPLVIDFAEAEARLGGIADLIVAHDRPILARTDDSVVRVIAARPRVIRRARGYAPTSVPLRTEGPPVLALGAHLKTTVCVTRGAEAFLSAHIGDLDDGATRRFHHEARERLLAALEVAPDVVAHDLHPDLFTTRVAEDLGLPSVAVQHHHAHIAAVLAEHGRDEAVLGLALDGYGYGEDGGAWGGELLRVSGASFRRLGKLSELALVGGDRAAREPVRMAVAALVKLGRTDEIVPRLGLDEATAKGLVQMIERGVNAPPTSSCGRLFDAAAALLGIRRTNRHEAEAAMALEAAARRPRVMEGGFTLTRNASAGEDLDLAPTLSALLDLAAGDGAELFIGTLSAGLFAWAESAARREGLGTVALSGGCIQNRLLTEDLVGRLSGAGLEVLLPERVPANDGGLSLGQAWVAQRAAR